MRWILGRGATSAANLAALGVSAGTKDAQEGVEEEARTVAREERAKAKARARERAQARAPTRASGLWQIHRKENTRASKARAKARMSAVGCLKG